VIFTDRSIRVIYKDKEQLTNLLPSADVIYLPIKYTSLTVTHPQSAWRALAGTITIELSPQRPRAPRRATITLSNVTLRNSAGATVRISRPVKLTAVVGAVFG